MKKRRRINKSVVHRQIGLAYQKFGELRGVLDRIAAYTFCDPKPPSQTLRKARRGDRGGKRQRRAANGRFVVDTPECVDLEGGVMALDLSLIHI